MRGRRRPISGCGRTMNQLLRFTGDVASLFALKRMDGDRGGAPQCQRRGTSSEHHRFDLGAVQPHVLERAVIERAQGADRPPAFQPGVIGCPPFARRGSEQTDRHAGPASPCRAGRSQRPEHSLVQCPHALRAAACASRTTRCVSSAHCSGVNLRLSKSLSLRISRSIGRDVAEALRTAKHYVK